MKFLQTLKFIIITYFPGTSLFLGLMCIFLTLFSVQSMIIIHCKMILLPLLCFISSSVNYSNICLSLCFHSFVDLPNLTASIYSVELSNRIRSFLVACPPAGPSSPVADLVIATADFQKDLASWNIW
jgi:hypothetical protein